jgi:hypothetical protein
VTCRTANSKRNRDLGAALLAQTHCEQREIGVFGSGGKGHELFGRVIMPRELSPNSG